MDVKSTWIPTWHLINCVSWSLGLFSKNHLLEVGLTQNQETDHGIPNAHNCWFILFYNVRGFTSIKIHWNNSWLRARSHMTSHYTWGSVTTLSYMILEVCWDGLWTLSFGLSQFLGHNSWLVCEVTLSTNSLEVNPCNLRCWEDGSLE